MAKEAIIYRFLKAVAGWIIGAILAVSMIWMMSIFGPSIEGGLRPVAIASDFTVSVQDSQSAVLEGKMVKLRDCDFQGLEAYHINPRGQRVIANLNVKETVRLRDTGEWHWGPWEVNLPAWQASAQMQIVVYHQCHPFWVTETLFFPSELAPAYTFIPETPKVPGAFFEK